MNGKHKLLAALVALSMLSTTAAIAMAKTPAQIKSTGRIESQDVIIDSDDFNVLNNAYESGKQATYDNAFQEGYTKGYAEGMANQPSVTANVTYTYHHHDIGNGDPTEISFSAEEVQDGTKDAWFAAHPVPEKMSSAIGDYTKENVHQEQYIASYTHHKDYVHGTGTWEQSPSGSMNWTGQVREYDTPNYATRTVSDGFVPACGHSEGECIRVTIELD